MKHISKRDAERILTHIRKATAIFEAAEAASDDGQISMNGELVERIHLACGGLEFYTNNTNWED